MELIKYPSPNYGLRRDDTKIDFIILHYTAMGAYIAVLIIVSCLLLSDKLIYYITLN